MKTPGGILTISYNVGPFGLAHDIDNHENAIKSEVIDDTPKD